MSEIVPFAEMQSEVDRLRQRIADLECQRFFGTTGEDIANQELSQARERLLKLRKWVDKMLDELTHCKEPQRSFVGSWCDPMMEHAFAICRHVTRANVVMLVRTKEPEVIASEVGIGGD